MRIRMKKKNNLKKNNLKYISQKLEIDMNYSDKVDWQRINIMSNLNPKFYKKLIKIALKQKKKRKFKIQINQLKIWSIIISLNNNFKELISFIAAIQLVNQENKILFKMIIIQICNLNYRRSML